MLALDYRCYFNALVDGRLPVVRRPYVFVLSLKFVCLFNMICKTCPSIPGVNNQETKETETQPRAHFQSNGVVLVETGFHSGMCGAML